MKKELKPIIFNDSLISFCGFYCGSCPKLLKEECKGCKGDNPAYLKACKVRPCNMNNNYSSCADCKKYNSVRECNDYNPLLIRFGQFITGTCRRKGIEMIKEKGRQEFVKFMIDNRFVTVKNKHKSSS